LIRDKNKNLGLVISGMAIDKEHLFRVAVLFLYFCTVAFLLWAYDLGYIILPILVISAALWLIIEFFHGVKKKDLYAALEIGLFLMVFDFIIENFGAALGFWQTTKTALPVIHVPIEIMLLTLIGGTAWALAQPKEFSRINSALDIVLFSVFGALGESLLIKNQVMVYMSGWNPVFAFLGYFITWSMLHYLRYRAVPVFKWRF
jgi:hypothetical protein